MRVMYGVYSQMDNLKLIQPHRSSYPHYVGMLDLYYSHNPIIKHLFWKRLFLALKLAHLVKSHNSLEIGFGPGVMLPTLAQYTSSVVALGLENKRHFLTVKEMCKKERISDKVHLVNGDARKIPFRDYVFDRIFAMDVLEHIPELEKALDEVALVLKRDCSFLISIPIETWFRKALRKLFRRPIPIDFHDCQDINAACSKIFKINAIKKVSFLFYPFFFVLELTRKDNDK